MSSHVDGAGRTKEMNESDFYFEVYRKPCYLELIREASLLLVSSSDHQANGLLLPVRFIADHPLNVTSVAAPKIERFNVRCILLMEEVQSVEIYHTLLLALSSACLLQAREVNLCLASSVARNDVDHAIRTTAAAAVDVFQPWTTGRAVQQKLVLRKNLQLSLLSLEKSNFCHLECKCMSMQHGVHARRAIIVYRVSRVTGHGSRLPCAKYPEGSAE